MSDIVVRTIWLCPLLLVRSGRVTGCRLEWRDLVVPFKYAWWNPSPWCVRIVSARKAGSFHHPHPVSPLPPGSGGGDPSRGHATTAAQPRQAPEVRAKTGTWVDVRPEACDPMAGWT